MPVTKTSQWAIVGLAVLIMGSLMQSGCEENGDSWERIEESGVLRVGIDPTFPPFALAEGDIVEGIDVDLARALAGELGLDAQFSYFGYDGLYDALTTGQVDVLISALVMVPERTKEIAYTRTYFDAGQYLFVPTTTDILEMADLNNQILAVELGALGHVEALRWKSRLDNLTIQTHGNANEALEAVVSGAADAALVDSVTGLLYLHDQSGHSLQLNYLHVAVLPEPYAIAVRIEDEILLEELNRALSHLEGIGSLEGIIGRWLVP